MSSGNPAPFTLQVASGGPAQGKTFTGLANPCVGRPGNADAPLVVAIHGGGYHSTYFSMPGHSLLDRGAALGVPVIAVDRPNYGGSDAPAAQESIFQANVDALDHLIAELWAEHGEHHAGVFVVGHSIGGALSLLLAAGHPEWPLVGVSISGCLLREPPGYLEQWASMPFEWMPCEPAMRLQLMFGPEGSYDSDVPAAEAAHHGDTPVLVEELVEISDGWDERFAAAAPSITVPVHVRHSEFDHLWISDQEQVQEFAQALTNAPVVDVELWPGVGHVIDYHRAGAAFQTQQLAFALTAAAHRVGV